MPLKKKDIIKQVKNFTLNFGPQHPAAENSLNFIKIIIFLSKNNFLLNISLNIGSLF
jgi:NADH:ubiquinone oxidoreductase subunit D